MQPIINDGPPLSRGRADTYRYSSGSGEPGYEYLRAYRGGQSLDQLLMYLPVTTFVSGGLPHEIHGGCAPIGVA